MWTVCILYIICISNLSLRSEYESKLEDESGYNDVILTKLRDNMLSNNERIFFILSMCYSEFFDSFYNNVGGKVFINLLKSSDSIVRHILNYILKENTNRYLLKLILNIKLDKDKDMSNYLVSSVHSTLLIQDLIIVSSTYQEIEENIDCLVYFMREKLDDDFFTLFVEVIYENNRLTEKLIIYDNTWFYLSLDYHLVLNEKYKCFLNEYSRYLNIFDLYQVERSFDVPFFKTRYYKIINEGINCFENASNDTFFFLFNHKGFKYNRITNSSMIELYINNCYKTFMKYDDIYETELESTDIDISYLQGKVFYLPTKEFFQYVMGLLQYVSCSYKKHIICSYRKNSFEIEMLNVADVPLEMILDYYKSKNDLTNKIRDEPETYSNKYFVSIVEGREYRFTKQDGDVKVNSECLLLNCSHILGNELLIEYFSNLSTKCHLCNTEFEVIGYFAVDLFTNVW